MMPTTTLEPSFLRAVVLMASFAPRKMLGAQAALLAIALRRIEFTAADLPAELCVDKFGRPSAHLAGAATGGLIAQGLLDVVRRMKSPDPSAKGRKLDVLRLPPSKEGTILAWFAANGLARPPVIQQELPLERIG
jgi:hypothetical protein